VTYQIELSKSVEKQLEDIPKSDLKKIFQRIDKLSSNPFPSGYEKLKGIEDLYRVRQGDYRVIYSVFEKKLLVLILKIGHRREVYR
jgi:mRNA interferase RelE/StbE